MTAIQAEPTAVVAEAVARAGAAQRDWALRGDRAEILRAAGAELQARCEEVMAIVVEESSCIAPKAFFEVFGAADELATAADAVALTEPVEVVVADPERRAFVARVPLGVIGVISPWNFPLLLSARAIAPALAAGNAVLAKPAEQTPFIAAAAVKLFHAAGLNPDLLALLPGDGATVGAALVVHPGVHGVAFTGGTDTARAINRQLADRPGPIVPFIAETGGLNGLFADSTALREQVVDDVIVSAIGSAGQRCSALRLLFLPKDTADTTIAALTGALDTLVIGDPADPATDVGPVIDEEARGLLDAHVERLEREAKILARRDIGGLRDKGSFFGPVIAEVPSPDFLAREVFGPVLHVYRYDPQDLASVATALADRGYGLTLGVHSRIDRFAEEVRALVPAGNFYVNRSIVGAVVGVQPFGGEGLSGTGPKAGGPHALLRYAVERAVSINITAQGGDPALLNL